MIDNKIIPQGQKYAKDTQVSNMYGIGLQTLRNWRSEGKGPAYSKIGRGCFYNLQDVEAYFLSRKVEPRA